MTTTTIAYPLPRAVPPQTSQLAAALAAFQAELPDVKKTRTGEISGTSKTGKPYSYTYKYADLADVSAVVLKAIGKHGLSFMSKPMTVNGKFGIAYSLMHSSGEREDGFFELRDDPDIQRVGGRITYARRYCLCAVTGVAAEEDTDAQHDAGPAAPKRQRGKPPERAPGNLPRNADGSVSRSQSTDDELAAAGLMTAAQQAEHSALQKDASRGTVPGTERLTEPDPDDPWPGPPQPLPLRAPVPSRGVVGIIVKHFERIGITDREERLVWTSRLAGRELASSNDMTAAEALIVKDKLSRCGDLSALEAAREAAVAAGDGDA